MSATTLAVELLIAAAVLWLLLGPASSVRLQRRMAYWLGLVEDLPPCPVLVLDGLGNIWRWHNDVGYVQSVARSTHEQPAQPSLVTLTQEHGPTWVVLEAWSDL